MKVEIRTRTDRYNAAVNLTEAGVKPAAVARVIGSDVQHVANLLSLRSMPEGRRNAFLMGIDVKKFRCV